MRITVVLSRRIVWHFVSCFIFKSIPSSFSTIIASAIICVIVYTSPMLSQYFVVFTLWDRWHVTTSGNAIQNFLNYKIFWEKNVKKILINRDEKREKPLVLKLIYTLCSLLLTIYQCKWLNLKKN